MNNLTQLRIAFLDYPLLLHVDSIFQKSSTFFVFAVALQYLFFQVRFYFSCDSVFSFKFMIVRLKNLQHCLQRFQNRNHIGLELWGVAIVTLPISFLERCRELGPKGFEVLLFYGILSSW